MPGGQIVGDDGGAVLHVAQVLHREGGHALGEDDAVDDADGQPEHRDDDEGEDPPLEDRGDQQGGEDQQGIVAEDQGFVDEEPDAPQKVGGGEPAQGLDDEIEHQRPDHGKGKAVLGQLFQPSPLGHGFGFLEALLDLSVYFFKLVECFHT